VPAADAQRRVRERNRAHLRFFFTMLILLVAIGVIALLIWQQTQRCSESRSRYRARQVAFARHLAASRPILPAMQTPTSSREPHGNPRPPLAHPSLRHPDSLLLASDTLTWLSGWCSGLSTFMSWYSGRADDSGGYPLVLSVIGWHTGLVGQLVFFLGFAVLVLFALRMFGIALPASLPESLIGSGSESWQRSSCSCA